MAPDGMRRSARRLWWSWALPALLGGLCCLQAHAAVPSSASFRVYGDGLNLLSGRATSTNFAVRDCLGPGPEAAGAASSASFKIQIGCIDAFLGLPADDDDGDGVNSGTENAAPNNGDGNGDGIADSTQGNVASVPAASGSGFLTIDIPPGGTCGQLLNVQAVDPATLDGGDPGFIYPFGMIRFRIEPCAGPVMVTLFLHGNPAAVNLYRKFGHMAPDYVSPRTFYTFHGASFGTTTIGSQLVRTVTFSLADNVLGDDSPVALRIEDPSGPAFLPATAPVVSPAGLLVVAVLLFGVAALRLRRS